MVCFVGQQNDSLFSEVLVGQCVLFGTIQVDMKLLDGGEADIDVVCVDAFKVADRRHGNGVGTEMDGVIEEIFG